jgi:universal stress protein E
MRRIRRILVAVKNPARESLPAVSKAAQLARGLNAQLILFHAISEPPTLDADISLLSDALADFEQTTRRDVRARLEVIAQRLRRQNVRTSISAEWDFPVYEAILRETYRIGADLVVTEQHGGSHFGAGLLRLTDWELLRHSPVPVLLIKDSAPYHHPVVLAAVDPDHSYGKPRTLDDEILRNSASVTSALRGTLHAMHAYVRVPLTSASAGLSTAELLRLESGSARAAAAKLRRAVLQVHIPKSRRHIVGRHPSDSIEQVAAETHSALVVMGALSRSGFKSLLIGNTAEKVLDRLQCDVLVVKPPLAVARVPRKARARVRYAMGEGRSWIE